MRLFLTIMMSLFFRRGAKQRSEPPMAGMLEFDGMYTIDGQER
jgi:hypothetical protein